jgi:hypothetical protein
MPLLDRKVSAAIGMLQSLDDAIAFRFCRLDQPCQECADDQKCMVHAYDERLIERCQARYAAAFCDAIAGMDPYEVGQILRRGDGIPPTAALLRTAVLTRALEAAADGPVVADLDAGSVLIERDGGVVAKHPPSAGSDS